MNPSGRQQQAQRTGWMPAARCGCAGLIAALLILRTASAAPGPELKLIPQLGRAGEPTSADAPAAAATALELKLKLATTLGSAPEAAADPSALCARAGRREIPWLDRARIELEERGCRTALWLDGLLSGHGDIDAARRTRGYVQWSNVDSQFDGFDSRMRMHIEFDLPTAKNRLSAFVGREPGDDFLRGRSETTELRQAFPTLSENNKWLAGLGYLLPGTDRLQTSVRVGVRGVRPPTGFLQGELRYTLYADDHNVAFTSTTPFWNTKDGFGLTQTFDLSRVLSPRFLLRWYTVGTESERTRGLNWRNSLILYQNLHDKRGMAYEAFIRGETDEPEPLFEYGVRALYRHPLFQQRLFAEWAVGYSFPRTDPTLPRDGSANVGLSLQLPFGDAPEGP